MERSMRGGLKRRGTLYEAVLSGKKPWSDGFPITDKFRVNANDVMAVSRPYGADTLADDAA